MCNLVYLMSTLEGWKIITYDEYIVIAGGKKKV